MASTLKRFNSANVNFCYGLESLLENADHLVATFDDHRIIDLESSTACNAIITAK